MTIGTDLVKIERLKSYLENNKKLERFFSKKEIDEVKQKGIRGLETLAGKFAAKEAFLKAISHYLEKRFAYKLKDIEIIKNNKLPIIKLNGKLESFMEENKIKTKITISHEKEYALAFVLIGKNI